MAKKKSQPTENQPEAQAIPDLPEDLHGAFDDQRTVESNAVAGIEILRTVVDVRCASLGNFSPGEEVPVTAVATEYGAEVTLCHTKNLESALPRIQQTQVTKQSADENAFGLDAYRELVWELEPARNPRATIVGRALHDLKATTKDNPQPLLAVCECIQKNGKHHLRTEFEKPLAEYLKPGSNSSKSSSALAKLLEVAITYLDQRVWISRRNSGGRKGLYLVGRALQIFDGFPDWARQDDDPTPSRSKPRRKIRRDKSASSKEPQE